MWSHRTKGRGVSSGSKWPSCHPPRSQEDKDCNVSLALATRSLCALSENSVREARQTDRRELRYREEEVSGDRLSRAWAVSTARRRCGVSRGV